jgi:hypothetical protein
MLALENQAKLQGLGTVIVESSLTVHNFYKHLGYQEDVFGNLGVDMHKDL